MKTNFSSEQEFILTISPYAQKACKRYGYLPSVLIAQACLENGYGISSYWDNPEIKYLLQYNNMIGQKAELLNSTWYDKSVWPGKSFNKNTPQVYSNKLTNIKDNFRIFDDIEQSFCDFILFLLYASNEGYNKKPKYGKVIVDIKDPTLLIKQVSNRGYATDPNYPNSIINIIKKHNLTQYDDLSKIDASNYIPNALKNEYQNLGDQNMKIISKTIKDITAANLNQIPMSRGNNPIQWIVIHYLGVPNADNPYLYGSGGDRGFGGHYYVARNGDIYKVADPSTAIVWHCGGGLQGSKGHQYHGICTNFNSIGIENGVCYTDPSVKSPNANSNQWYFTEETQESLVYLVSTLMDKYNIDINHVIRHYDVTGKICPNPYVKNNKLKTSWTWDEFKSVLADYRSGINKSGSEKIPTTDQKAEETTKTTNYPAVPFTVKVLIDDLNIRQGASTKYSSNGYTGKGSFTITEVSGDWGKLKSGAGWIYIGEPDWTEIITLSKDTEKVPTPAPVQAKKIEDAQSFNKSIARTYVTTANLNLRTGANLSKNVVVVIPKNSKVTCYGYYTNNWYYVQYKDYTGFCSKDYLK